MKKSQRKKTTVGVIDQDVLAYTAGRDRELDLRLVEADCIGSAAHARMLAAMKVKPRFFSKAELDAILRELVAILHRARAGRFAITLEDQDVHLAVERTLTARLGDLGRKIHTGRSRNDQVAVDIRIFMKGELLDLLSEIGALVRTLTRRAQENAGVPMVGRTHMQPAMPASVGMWLSAHAETLLDDAALVMGAYELNDMCPLGSAAGYGVPLPIEPALTAGWLGFSRPCPNAMYAANARGKHESILLGAFSQVMLTLSRLAQDLMLFTMPEFGYFSLPVEYCTGSSIMPQKKNPDVLELLRAKASLVQAGAQGAFDIVKNSPSGYNRDLQETKGLLFEGTDITRASVRIMERMIAGLTVNTGRCLAAFTPAVFATDETLRLVFSGMPFRAAYDHVKAHLGELQNRDPVRAIAAKDHLGGTANLDYPSLLGRAGELLGFADDERQAWQQAVSKVLGIPLAKL